MGVQHVGHTLPAIGAAEIRAHKKGAHQMETEGVRDDSKLPTGLFWAKSSEVERVDALELLADADQTNGAIGVVRGSLGAGKNGAHPHYHHGFSEALYVLSGELAVLGDTQVVTAQEGDLLVVPTGMVHAFCASASVGAEYLLAITPAVNRFEYFRARRRLRREGLPSPDSLQDEYDNHNVDSAVWAEFLARNRTSWA
jgi:quercetin dioxygenase-like cupin family protein